MTAAHTAMPIPWPAEAVWQAVAPLLPGFTVEILPETDSTNTELLRRLRRHHSAATAPAGPAEALLLVAETQTAGRGRMGRQWHSQRGASLTFSLSLPLRVGDWSGLSLAVGVSLSESLSPGAVDACAPAPVPAPARLPARIGLKWPNDLWLVDERGERKLGGILVETATWDGLRYAVIGVGLNIAAPPDAAPADPGTGTGTGAGAGNIAPAWLQQVQGDADAAGTLLRVVPPLVADLLLFAQAGFGPFAPRFDARDVLRGRTIDLSDGRSGMACGVGANGALRLQTAHGMQDIISSEISVRPVDRPTAQAQGPSQGNAPAC